MDWLEAYAPLDGVRLNMVVGAKGSFTDESGSSRGISNDTDRALIKWLRSISDVVVTGGHTARNESYRNTSKLQLAVISRKPAVTDGRITLTPPTTTEVGPWTIDALRTKGFHRVLLEVGPSLAGEFLSKNLVDEFCLTVTSGNEQTAVATLTRFGSRLKLAESFRIEGTLFTIWRRGND